jgi:RNA-directed DNA polymerase
MTPKRRASLNLADTLLAVRPELDAMMAGTVHAFGKNWRWIPGLCKHILRRTEENFHDYSRKELAEIIESHEAYSRAWLNGGERLRIARYALEAPLPAPRPQWVPHDLPLLRSPKRLAEWLGLLPEELAWFSGSWRHDERASSRLAHYAYRWVPKRSGGFRLIEMPKSRLREIQRLLLHGLLERIPVHQAAHGFIPGRSCLTHASLHQGKAAVIRMDLQDFFSSIPASRIHALFAKLGCPTSVARLLTGISTHPTPWRELNSRENRARIPFAQRQRLHTPHLPQGAPTSPALANLCAFRLDLRLDALAKSLNAVYSRYADDLVFSGDKDFLARAERFHILVAAIALEEGFSLNMRKTRIMGAGQRQKITGLVVNRFPNIPRKDYDRLKAVLHNCLLQGAASQNREGMADFRAHLMGRISYAASINPQKGERLMKLFEQINWAI